MATAREAGVCKDFGIEGETGNASVINLTKDWNTLTRKPNYFIAIQVTNPQIHNGIEELQEFIVRQQASLEDALIHLKTLHLTLMLVHIEDSEIDRAKSALAECRNQMLRSTTNLPRFSIAGLGNFNDSVVFAKIPDSHGLQEVENIAETVFRCFTVRGFPSAVDGTFKPHITVLKLSRAPWLRRAGVTSIDPALYSSYSARSFGQQIVTGLQLCSMSLDEDTGYYCIAHEVQLI